MAYEHRPVSISVNLINETLLYYHIHSPHLPSAMECIDKLYDKELSIQQEYAFYLSLMGKMSSEIETKILERLVCFYQEKFFDFKTKVLNTTSSIQESKPCVTDLPTQLALIDTLDHMNSDNEEVHLFLLFLAGNPQENIKNNALKALEHIQNKALKTFKKLKLPSAYISLLKY